MAQSQEPFLGYLTVFRSRLGLANLVLDVTPLGHQPDQALRRRVRRVLEQRSELSLADEENYAVFQYLRDKRLVGANERSSGRYRGLTLSYDESVGWEAESKQAGRLSKLAVFQTDIWLAHPSVPSTIGVPTPENTEEVVSFAFQLRLLDRTKNSWTTTAHLIDGLRRLGPPSTAESGNPFLLGTEISGLWRCVLERDGLLMRELLRFLAGQTDVVRRDDVAAALPDIAEQAVAAAKTLGLKPDSVLAGRRLVERLRETASNVASGAPGVLEHRISPRLEWLVDLGYLSKEGREKNDFTYDTKAGIADLVEMLDRVMQPNTDWPQIAALETWRSNKAWGDLAAHVAIQNEESALATAYKTLRRPIGPAPLRDVAFVAGLTCSSFDSLTVVDRVMELTRGTPGASLSGGRTSRAPENIYLTDDAVARLSPE